MSEFIECVEEQPKQEKVVEWLLQQLNNQTPFLLAFADDGVIWRKWVNGEIIEPSESSDLPKMPTLREKTLQQAFVFGAECEVRLSRDEMFTDENPKWKTLRVVDGTDPELVIRESQVLWGEEAQASTAEGFIYAKEHLAGIAGQWLPLKDAFGKDQCARLEIHHLVEVDEKTGEARIALSRLAGLSVDKRAMEVER